MISTDRGVQARALRKRSLMNEIAALPARERAELFQETAARKSVSSVVAMEKDFWVCWILGLVFHGLHATK